ncbi:hypothetical protein ES288_D01G208800v1 [Gossypium darwinii]|uniref:TOD1/MUCI70 glycosyltransferase-like domain-containing protein n=1 Tax=Gossypium darwinii TaxID=34276 RepID=A0A5D2DSF5_GOSDA|nr:hypothetical protein ES288_D01G208800v1 [Gossypium darwinii]
MDTELQRPLFRLSRRGECNNQHPYATDDGGGLLSSRRLPQENPIKIMWKQGFIRLVFVAGILWLLVILVGLLFHVFFLPIFVFFLSNDILFLFYAPIGNKESKVFISKDLHGLTPKAEHRCLIPVASDPEKIVIPDGKTPDVIVKGLTYIEEEDLVNNGSHTFPLFGGNQSWLQREKSFKLKPNMEKCRFVVASGTFDGYDVPHQPSNISIRSKKLFCFLMNVTVRKDRDERMWVGIWRLIPLKHLPYDEPRRKGKVPKILTHRLFPEAQYSIWIDGKMELIVDPLLILERYLWHDKLTYAIAQHKHHRSIYEEADANKRRKRYAKLLIDLLMNIYYYEGMEPWSLKKNTISDVPEGAIIIREHTALSNLFNCLWFNEVNLFTPRDQLSFGYIVYRLRGLFKFFMFQIAKHSSKVEWTKSLSEFKGNGSSMKESRGGFGLWIPYPKNLDSVILPPVVRTSKAG